VIARAYVKEAQYEWRRTLRMPALAVPLLLLPVALYLLFAVLLFGEAVRTTAHGSVYMFSGFAVMGAMAPGVFGFGVLVALEREQGLQALKRALPMPPLAYLSAKLAMAMLSVAVAMLTMILAAIALGHVTLAPLRLLAIAAIAILGALPFCALGLLIGTFTPGKAAPAIANLVYLALIYLSALLIPLPKSVEWLALLSPAFHLDQLMLALARVPHAGGTISHLAVLVAITLACTWLSARRLGRVE
jgi:ABC-2 type transport system permease protein